VKLENIDGFLLDLDGTLYLGGELFAETPAFLQKLKERSKPYLCLTNNSSAAGSDYVAKLNRMGIPTEPAQVMTSGQATIHYLLEHTEYRSAYLVGNPALQGEFEAAGIRLEEENPDCLVVGYDTTVDYHKLCVATRLLFRDKPYFATHPDRTCINEDELLPDIAAIIAGLEAVTRKLPEILGKPEKPMVEAAAARVDVPLSRLAMVGDQLDTDMTMAKRFGLMAILVLSGETSREQLKASSVKPDLVLENIGQLTELL
jgi:HAD superfamily hydrolase (TIGR01450 family)